MPKWFSDLKYGPCPPARDFGSRVSGLVLQIDQPGETKFTKFKIINLYDFRVTFDRVICSKTGTEIVKYGLLRL